MKVIMQTTMAGPDGVVQAGRVANVNPRKAKALIAGGFARPYKEPAKPIETTTAPAAQETTSGPDTTEKTGDAVEGKDDETAESEDDAGAGAAGQRKRGILGRFIGRH